MHLFLLAAFLSIPQVQASQPNRQPELAAGHGLIALAFGSGSLIQLSVSHDNGQHFGPPAEVAHVPVLALGRHRGPHVVISGNSILVSAVYGQTVSSGPHAHGLPADGDLVVWRSTDEGRSWSEPVVINDVPGAPREGLHAMAVGQNGEIAAAWLDLRSGGTKLYGAYSTSGGKSWSKNVLIYESPDGSICQCCHPSLVSTGNHEFAVMFRNEVHGSRDMYLTRWQTGSTIAIPEKLGTDSWNINACPMDGGGIAIDGNKVLTAWRRDRTVYLDRAGQGEVALGEGKDVALAVSANGPYVLWTAAAGVEVRRPQSSQAQLLSSGGSFPAVTTLANGSVLAAWEQDGRIQVVSLDEPALPAHP